MDYLTNVFKEISDQIQKEHNYDFQKFSEANSKYQEKLNEFVERRKKLKKKRKRKKQNQIFLIKMLQNQANNGQMIYSLQITIQS